MSKTFISLALLTGSLLLSCVALAQNPPPSTDPPPPAEPPPSTEIYLVEVKITGASILFGQPVNVTKRPGYDNQPHFLPDGKSFVYTRIDDDGQADIWAYDLKKKVARAVIETAKTSEYSPTPMPGENALSVIRVEADGETQRLWRFPMGGGEPEVLLPDIKPVGYHAWTDDKNLALFVLGEPHTLQAARRGPGVGKTLAGDIGRALHRVPGSPMASFVHKEGDGNWHIKKADLASGEMEILAKTRPGREDFTWLTEDYLLMGDGSTLYIARPGEDWKVAADFKDAGLSDISRIAVHPEGDWVAFVAVPGERPATE